MYENQNKKSIRQAVTAMLVIALIGTTLSSFARAKQTGDKLNYSFTGRMVHATPCSVNGDQPVSVTFGNVGVSKIDTGKYVQNLNYTLECGVATASDKVGLTIIAIPAAWDTKAIATSADGLGAQILKDGSPLELNTQTMITDPSRPPVLQVLLVKNPAVTLTEQAFTATGTFLVDYI